MLRHSSALRVAAAHFRRFGSRSRGKHACVAASRGPNVRHTQVPLSSPGVMFCCHLHQETRRRRDGSEWSTPPIPRKLSFSPGLCNANGKRSNLERCVLAAMASTSRATFSSEEGGGAGSKTKAEIAQSGMDAETRKSIGQGDKKSKDSMKTVKVSFGGMVPGKNIPQRLWLMVAPT